MALTVSGISHAAIRVTDLARARAFYVDFLGFPVVLEGDDVVVVKVGNALLGVRGDAPDTPAGDRFDPLRVGLDHLALVVDNAADLEEMKRVLDDAGVRNEGVMDDTSFDARALVFYDPDGIAIELYAMRG